VNWASLILRKGGLLSPSECNQLETLARGSDGDALEIGHYTGLSTCVIAWGLPEGRRFVTVDNHQWRSVSVDTFLENTDDFVYELDFELIVGDFQNHTPPGPYGFIFYDASHAPADVGAFVSMLPDLAAEHCTVVFDDWDWTEDFTTLEPLGFTLEPHELYRHEIEYSTGDLQVDYDLGKRHPDTFTLGVWKR
jgi:predicted O-methyltransferase YrrM